MNARRVAAAVAIVGAALAGGGSAAAGPASQVKTATPAVAASGADSSCLRAAHIAPPAWGGARLDPAAAARIGRQFVALNDQCLAARGGSAPAVCRDAAVTLTLYGRPGANIAALDAQYKRQWRSCVNA